MPEIFCTREPLLNRQGKIVATRLIFDLSSATLPAEGEMAAALVTLDQLLETWPVGEKTVFVGLHGAAVGAGLFAWHAPENVAIEVNSQAFAGEAGNALLGALRGRNVALCLHYDEQASAALASGLYFRFIGIDMLRYGPGELKAQVAHTAALGIPVAFTAMDPQSFHAAIEAGVSAASGWFFKQPTHPPAKTINPSHAHIVRVLNLVRSNANVAEIETALKQDVALSYKLLRYINSAGFGLSCEIQSFRHAVTILGYDKLNRWLSLLLATASKDPMAPALMHTALSRGRMMELLGRGLVDNSEFDNLFITGAFSLLNVMLGVDMEQILDAMHLPEPISDALLGNGGVYAPFLDLALACEATDATALAGLAAMLGLTADQVNRAQLEALNFADRLEF